jgi:hypothetical protein
MMDTIDQLKLRVDYIDNSVIYIDDRERVDELLVEALNTLNKVKDIIEEYYESAGGGNIPDKPRL